MIRFSFVVTLCLAVFVLEFSFPGPAQSNAKEATAESVFKFAGMPFGTTNSAAAWVDSSDDSLHLKIYYDDDNSKWRTADVFSRIDTHYGIHRFYLTKENPTLDAIDPNLVAGLFIIQNDVIADAQPEVDFEFSRWRDPATLLNAQFAIQPANDLSYNRHRFNMGLNAQADTVHTMNWQPGSIAFTTATGSDPNNTGAILQKWTYTGENIPQESNHIRVDLDFWIKTTDDPNEGPTNGLGDEIVITDAEFPGICRTAGSLYCENDPNENHYNTITDSTITGDSYDQIDSYQNGGWYSWNESGREITYKLKPSIDGTVTVSLSGLNDDLDIFVVSQAESGGAVFCTNQNTLTGGNETASFTAVAGKQYYAVVDGFIGSSGDFTLTMDCSGTTPPEDPEHDYYSSYIPIAINN